ncbi:MAG: hypothetical protein JWQ43_2357 [Glaciihabitans sp.]|nr:hypothetical protein [Glaciihabitans sp.]
MSTVATEDTSTRAVRPGTIVWGVVLLVIATLAALTTFLRPVDYTPTFYIWAVLAVGGLLVLAGIVGAIARAATRSARPTSAKEKANQYPPTTLNDADRRTTALNTTNGTGVTDGTDGSDVRDLFR